MINKYPNTNDLRKAFAFLETDLKFEISRDDDLSYGCYVDYIGEKRKVSIGFDFKDYSFYNYIYKSKKMVYSDSLFGKEIISIDDVALKFSPNTSIKNLQPTFNEGYKEALLLNAEILKKYGSEVLTGKKWLIPDI